MISSRLVTPGLDRPFENRLMPIGKKLRNVVDLVRHLGPRWIAFRAAYGLRRTTGLLKRRFPMTPWDAMDLSELLRSDVPFRPADYVEFRKSHLPPFFIGPNHLPERGVLAAVMGPEGRENTLKTADDYCHGRFCYFSRTTHDLGWPVDWLKVPARGARHDALLHWCDYPTFSRELGDVKDVWEPSRFTCAYWLVRAYALTRNEKYVEAFWRLFDSWCLQNPPNRGPNWKCGQETAVRLFAWCFALHAFWNSAATKAGRVAAMIKAVAVSAERIAGNIDYAISQKNNHSLGEAVSLLTAGLLFPELRGSRRWEERGRSVFEAEVARQVYEDGSYVQHSMNYHRVMLHYCLWAWRLCDLAGRPLADRVRRRITNASRVARHLLDEESGRAPNYGANDGALVLPLSACDYTDFRPTIQAAARLCEGRHVLGPGPWDETSLWLLGSDSLRTTPADPVVSSARFDAGGYYTIRNGANWCMIRCHTYRDRPHHCDLLHVDLWHRGVNVLGDSGTYRYYSPDEPEFYSYFMGIRAHNTIELDGRGPMELFSRFMWLPWPRARVLEHTATSFIGEHFAYDRPPWRTVHRRTVRRVDDRRWTIEDYLIGGGEHHVALRWHLADGPFRLEGDGGRLEIELPCGPAILSIEAHSAMKAAVHRGVADADRIAGWRSEYYGERTARPTLEITGRVPLPVRLVTRLELPAEPSS